MASFNIRSDEFSKTFCEATAPFYTTKKKDVSKEALGGATEVYTLFY